MLSHTMQLPGATTVFLSLPAQAQYAVPGRDACPQRKRAITHAPGSHYGVGRRNGRSVATY
jgi:hypothetical protein